MNKPEKLRVVIVEPGQYAREAEIDNTLQAEQAVVGGSFEVIYPWPDKNVCLVLNDEGKVIPLEPNRGLLEYRDIVFGTFFVCGDNGEDFCSLSDLQVKRFLQRFSRPEVFVPYCGHLLPILYDRRDLPNVPEAVRQETKERNGLPQICFSDMPGIPEVVLLEYGEKLRRKAKQPLSMRTSSTSGSVSHRISNEPCSAALPVAGKLGQTTAPTKNIRRT